MAMILKSVLAVEKGRKCQLRKHRLAALKGGSLQILNLGCGARTSKHCVNIDFSISVRLKRLPLSDLVGKVLLNEGRLERFQSLEGEILVHDLRKGIPFEDQSVDAVYHSHVLEHLERVKSDSVPGFLAEIFRVLKPDGIHRVVVPDMAKICREYLVHYDQCLETGQVGPEHDAYIGAIITQMVRREAHGTSLQGPMRRRIENLLLGGSERRGENHKWMYDRINLAYVLKEAGFREIRTLDYETSGISNWKDIGLDRGPVGEYKPESLYMEALK